MRALIVDRIRENRLKWFGPCLRKEEIEVVRIYGDIFKRNEVVGCDRD